MAKVYDEIDDKLGDWLTAQPMFVVATAPLSDGGLINVSPTSVTYLDLTGSGVKTMFAEPTPRFPEHRDVLDTWSERKSDAELDDYRAQKNSASSDGLPGLAS